MPIELKHLWQFYKPILFINLVLSLAMSIQYFVYFPYVFMTVVYLCSAALVRFFVDSVQFSYTSNNQLLTGGYLGLKVGDIIGLLGRNGTGKTTLMKIIFGSLRAQNAYIRVNGKKVSQAFPTREVCYLPQDSFL